MKIAIFSLALPAFLGCWVAQAADIPTESKRANEFFDKCWDETVARHPVDESFYGIKTHYDQLEDLSDEKVAADLKALQDQLATLHREFKLESLDASTQLSYKLFELDSSANWPDSALDFDGTDAPSSCANHREGQL